MTPDTTAYMVLGMVVSFGALGLYIASLYTRFRSLQQDEQALKEE